MIKTIEEKLLNLGYKVWEKGEKKRIYINDIPNFVEKTGLELRNIKGYKKDSMYYDCIKKDFYIISSITGTKSIIEMLKEFSKDLYQREELIDIEKEYKEEKEKEVEKIKEKILKEVEKQTTFINKYDEIEKVINTVKDAIISINNRKFFVDNKNIEVNFYSKDFFNLFNVEYPKRKFIKNMIRLQELENINRVEYEENEYKKLIEFFNSLEV